MVHCLCVLVTQTCPTPWTVARQAPPFMESSRQEHWSGLPFPSPGDLPDPGIKPGFPTLQADSLPSEPAGKPFVHVDGVTQASSSMNFYPGDKFWGPCPGLTSQDRVSRPVPGQTTGTQGSCRGLNPTPAAHASGYVARGRWVSIWWRPLPRRLGAGGGGSCARHCSQSPG